MTVAILSIRCHACGWTLLCHPDFAPRDDRWIECDNKQCPELGKRYVVPTVPLQPYRAKEANDA